MTIDMQTCADSPTNRKKTAAERRAQRLRADGRRLQHALAALNEVHNHRGGQLTKFGLALRESFMNSAHLGAQHFASSNFPVSQDTHCNGIEEVTAVAVDVSTVPGVQRVGGDHLPVSQGTQCNGFSDSATDADYGIVDSNVRLEINVY